DRETPEQGAELLASRTAEEMAACKLDQAKQHEGTAAPDRPSLQPKAEKEALKVLGDEGVLGTNQVEHLDHGAVGGNCAAGCERNGEHGRDQDQCEHREPAQERGPP